MVRAALVAAKLASKTEIRVHVPKASYIGLWQHFSPFILAGQASTGTGGD
jgi:hypothetical protein